MIWIWDLIVPVVGLISFAAWIAYMFRWILKADRESRQDVLRTSTIEYRKIAFEGLGIVRDMRHRDGDPICLEPFERCSDGAVVSCALPRGHACAHSWTPVSGT